MSQGQSIISRMMMVWMLLLAGFLTYRQFTQTAAPVARPPSANQTVQLH